MIYYYVLGLVSAFALGYQVRGIRDRAKPVPKFTTPVYDQKLDIPSIRRERN